MYPKEIKIDDYEITQHSETEWGGSNDVVDFEIVYSDADNDYVIFIFNSGIEDDNDAFLESYTTDSFSDVIKYGMTYELR